MDEKDKDYQRLLNYCFWLLGRRDYALAEMKKKLESRAAKLEMSSPPFEKIIARLQELGFVDDEKFARTWLKSKLAINPKGAFVLRQELQRKGVSKDVFEKVWEEVKVDDEVLAQQILERKERSLARLPLEKRKQRILGLLKSRGIRPGVIYDYLRKITSE